MVALASKQVGVIVAFLILDLLALVALGLRLYARSFTRRELKAHDVLTIISMIMLVGYTACLLVSTVNGGVGMHIARAMVSGFDVVLGLKAFFASQFFWAVSIASFRLAILDFYIQTFTVFKFRIAAYTLATIVVLFFIGSLTTTLRLCRPIAFNWDTTLNGSCGNEATAELAAAAFNMVLDIVIVLLPLPVTWKLQMTTQKKAAADFTYCTADSAILTVAEMAVGILVACVPTLGPVLLPSRRKRFTERAKPVGGSGVSGAGSSIRSLKNNSSRWLFSKFSTNSQRNATITTTVTHDDSRDSQSELVCKHSQTPQSTGDIAVWREFELTVK
ncbi:hypothetical protein BO85DRAFT_511357 [Aspergillus piperis CBS 112811]|uniref:Rhodopsin domain-containing protein n=1 Tax=Aspergillus piperis CBS 112811 TaxID=1448313 RepID=A0A8G1R454_9EURO|nr:hypothetical protein BO85DRAFT_511357 [Aspergillus piperis CBS 112811]RAH58923.1 hypothetical protein BO85DRAFT_511357 [Aspergillus piperis CBS 112811]